MAHNVIAIRKKASSPVLVINSSFQYAQSVLLCIRHGRIRTDPMNLGNQSPAFIGAFCLCKPATQVAELTLTPLATAQLPYACCCHVCSSFIVLVQKLASNWLVNHPLLTCDYPVSAYA
jgi:hypothetical protein